MKTRAIYTCDICNQDYGSSKEAATCEGRGTDKPIAAVGDIVFLKAGFGWFDGDKKWVSNPEVFLKRDGARCPQGDTNCFDECCTYKFYYVITAIDTDERNPHRVRYHVETCAMTGKQGHRRGWTYNQHHFTPKLVKDPPGDIFKQAQALIGNKAEHLF